MLQDLLTRQVPAGVIMFDMDRFKAINDTHGHPVRDRVLQRVAQRCQDVLRKNECLTRWGGEEFLIVVPDVRIAAVQPLAERLRMSIAQLSIEPVSLTSASVGITLIHDCDSLEDVLQRVDQALYRAKKQGGNVVARDRGVQKTPLATHPTQPLHATTPALGDVEVSLAACATALRLKSVPQTFFLPDTMKGTELVVVRVTHVGQVHRSHGARTQAGGGLDRGAAVGHRRVMELLHLL